LKVSVIWFDVTCWYWLCFDLDSLDMPHVSCRNKSLSMTLLQSESKLLTLLSMYGWLNGSKTLCLGQLCLTKHNHS